MLESSVLIPYLKHLHLLCSDLIVVLEFALEMYVCVSKGSLPQAVCTPEKAVHIKDVCSGLQSYVGQSGYFSVCESLSHTEKMLPERSQKQKGLLISLFPEHWWDLQWTQVEPDME